MNKSRWVLVIGLLLIAIVVVGVLSYTFVMSAQKAASQPGPSVQIAYQYWWANSSSDHSPLLLLNITITDKGYPYVNLARVDIFNSLFAVEIGGTKYSYSPYASFLFISQCVSLAYPTQPAPYCNHLSLLDIQAKIYNGASLSGALEFTFPVPDTVPPTLPPFNALFTPIFNCSGNYFSPSASCDGTGDNANANVQWILM